jgi:DNA-binding MarR family transcriptional regulator
MDRKKACEEIITLFIKLSNKYQALEKIPVDYGIGKDLYHSERHMLDTIGDNPTLNVSELARSIGVTKGAISQVVKKLEEKQVVKRHKQAENEKEVFVDLTELGKDIHKRHKQANKESIIPLHDELLKYSDDKVYFLIEMFKWIDTYLDSAKKQMLNHSKEKH